MQSEVMKFDPATGEPRPYPSHAEQWRRWHGHGCAWLFNPWSGERRDARDVGSDLNGRLIVAPETLGNDMGVAARLQNTANAKITGSEAVKLLGRWPAHLESNMEWQPIETIPTDGRRVLVYRPLAEKTGDRQIEIKRAYGGKNMNCWKETVPDGATPTNPTDGLCYPTHWAHLPSPPAA